MDEFSPDFVHFDRTTRAQGYFPRIRRGTRAVSSRLDNVHGSSKSE